MAISYVGGFAQCDASGALSITVTVPADTLDGDLIIVHAGVRNDAGAVTWGGTGDAAFTNAYDSGNFAGKHRSRIYAKIAASDASATYVWSVAEGYTTLAISMIVLRGMDTARAATTLGLYSFSLTDGGFTQNWEREAKTCNAQGDWGLMARMTGTQCGVPAAPPTRVQGTGDCSGARESSDFSYEASLDAGTWAAEPAQTCSAVTQNVGAIAFFAAIGTDPSPGIWIDWNLDGFATGASDNVTNDVTSVTWSRGASSDHVSAAGPGNATIIVQNSDGKYNPDNGASALTGKLLPNRPVWCGAIRTSGALSGSGTVRGFFAGYTTEIAPTPVPGGNPSAEILCEDALGSYRRHSASVSPSQSRSHGEFRNAILDAIGESASRRALDAETGMLPFSAADTRQALGLLEELNRATASRHCIAPADTKEDWYDYTVANKLHKLAAAADEEINADNVTDLSGYRVTWDNIVNEQRATVSPVTFGSINETVWTYGQVPFTLTSSLDVTIWAEFADYVFSASVLANYSGGTLTTTLTNFGRTAKLLLHVTGAAVTVSSLLIQGQHLNRGDNESVISATALTSVSQGKYDIHAGTDIDTDLIGQTGAAQGIVDYLAWKFAEPLKRPTITVASKDATTWATILDRDLFDVITLTVDRLNVVSRRFEIIGIRGHLVPGTFMEVSYELQETPNQSAVTYFTVDTDSVDGAQLIAPF